MQLHTHSHRHRSGLLDSHASVDILYRGRFAPEQFIVSPLVRAFIRPLSLGINGFSSWTMNSIFGELHTCQSRCGQRQFSNEVYVSVRLSWALAKHSDGWRKIARFAVLHPVSSASQHTSAETISHPPYLHRSINFILLYTNTRLHSLAHNAWRRREIT